tara:strand:+ start:540 stop:893 length:354 start_codon:yes stop_codon:yes gene_type:complete
MAAKPKQDMKKKAATRRARNARGGADSDYAAAKRRGDENAGKDSKSNKAHKLRRNMESNGTKFKKGEDAGHKKSSKSGGSSAASNGRKESQSSNRSKGGKSGNTAGKAAGGRKSTRT